MTERTIRLTDRYGASSRDDVTIGRLGDLLATIATPDGDAEHATVSITDSDSWNLAFTPDAVLFENLESDEVGRISAADLADRLAIGAEFIVGDFEALRARPWA
ncbi:hypothetical protein BH10ACT7_BH10ACT7_04160 [soil metagenome]